MRRALAIAALTALAFVDCERGCLATWIGDRTSQPGAGGASPERSGGATPGAAFGSELSGTDCSDGLVRCSSGAIEISRATHLPHPCGTPGKERQPGCSCPWELVGSCGASGCIEEGLEAVGSADAGLQLCRTNEVIARPILPSDLVQAEICAASGLSCRDEIVRVCDRAGEPMRALGVCLFGCQLGIEIEDGETKNPDGVLSILCRRNHAERR